MRRMFCRSCLIEAVVLCVVVVTVGGVTQAGEGATPTLVWQGFDYGWQHKIAGFETPHRLGTFVCALSSSPCNASRGMSNTTFHYTFTPGVDGDYAFPTGLYSLVDGLPAAKRNTVITSHKFRDSIDTSASIEMARSEEVWPVDLGATWPNATADASTDVTVMLNSLNITMACVAGNASCPICNSNGAWFDVFSVKLQSCNSLSRPCHVNVTLERTWTPTKGSGKPLSSCIDYSVTLDLLIIEGAGVHATTVFANHSLMHLPPPETVHISDEEASAFLKARRRTGSAVVTGLTGLSFNISSHPSALFPSPNMHYRGRYIEQYSFTTSQPTACGEEGAESLCYSVLAGITSPQVSTFPATVTSSISSVALPLPPGASVANSDTEGISGVVCEDDKAEEFHCKSKGLPQQLSGVATKPQACSP